MIGTTRSRVSFFMNRFRKLGFIEYNGRIKVHKSLLNAVLLDRLPEVNRQKPPASAAARTRSKPARSVAGAELSKFELGVVSTARIRTHVRAERKAGFSTIGAALALKPLRTDSVSRGLSISLFTRATILLSISIWLLFFIKRPFFER